VITIRPEWVMVGFPARPDLVPCAPGQVAILASAKMTQAQMEYTARSYNFRDWDDFRRNFKPHHTVAIELDDFVVVVADTYAEALAKLFANWMPPERMALPPVGQGDSIMTYPATDHGPDVPAGGTDTDGVTLSPANHPSDGPGVNYGTPPQYVGPDVPVQAPAVNPSAGNQGPPGGGVNPQGPSPAPGSVPDERYDQAPQNSSKGNPSY